MALDGIWWSLFIVFQASSVLLLRWWQAAAKSVGLLDGWMDGLLGWWHETNVMKWIIPEKKSRPTFSTSKSIAHVFIPQSQVVFYSDRSGVSGTTLGGPWEDPGDLMRWSWSMVIHPMHGIPWAVQKGSLNQWSQEAYAKLMPSLCQAFKIHLKEVFLMTFNFFRNFSFKHL